MWRHNGVLQELVVVISMAKGQSTQPEANAVIFTTEEDPKSWNSRVFKSENR